MFFSFFFLFFGVCGWLLSVVCPELCVIRCALCVVLSIRFFLQAVVILFVAVWFAVCCVLIAVDAVRWRLPAMTCFFV